MRSFIRTVFPSKGKGKVPEQPRLPSTIEGSDRPAVLQRQVSLNNEDLIGEAYTTLGVSLAFLQGLNVKYDSSFQDVCGEIQKLTVDAKGNRSLASYLMQNPKTKNLVGKADYFVSYAWSGGFGATFDALAKHFEAAEKPPFLWMDIAMVDQHAAATTDVDFDVWAKTFGESLKRIGKALLVLTPGDKPIAISRSWCCFEWVCIKQTGIPFEFCTKPSDAEQLIERMGAGMGFADFTNLFTGINVEKATAFKPSDERAILQLMRDIGVKEVNDIIMFSIKEWLMRAAIDAERGAEEGSVKSVCLLSAKAGLHQALGELDDALPLLEHALKTARIVPNYESGIANALNNLAALLSARGNFGDALKYAKESLDINERTLGEDHPLTITSQSWVGSLLQWQGRLNEALSILRSALEKRKRVLGSDHPGVAPELNNLAGLLSELGDFDGAIAMQREALEIQQKSQGREHPQFAAGLSNLATFLLDSNGDLAEAESLSREALVIDRRVLGDGHPDVATDLSNLAELLKQKGDYREAETLFREAIDLWQKTLGDDHPSLATGLNNLAGLLGATGDYDSAIEMQRQALDIQAKAQGRENLQFAAGLNNLANFLESNGDSREAEECYRDALAIKQRVLGKAHPN